MSWNWFVLFAYIAYAIGVTIFLIMDRRQPTSTFAWLLAMLGLPVVGLIIYILTGRTWKAFSRENMYVRRDIGKQLRGLLLPHLPTQETVFKEITKLEQPTYNRLLRLVHRNSYSAITLNNTVEILQNAQEKYPRLLEDIRNAKHSIHLEYFIWASDDYMQQVNDLLIAKAKEGVQVRLLYDAVGSFSVFKVNDRNRLKAAGVEVMPFSPVLRIHTISYRNHRKIAVIDGCIGYTGGLNMGKEHLEGMGGYKAWRDTHVRVTGQAARALQAAFVIDWYHGTRLALLDSAYFPPVTEPTETIPVQLISSGPDSRYESIRQLYFYMITTAQDHVYIQSPFFILDQSLSEGLKAAALAGVDVKIMLAPRGCGDNPVAYWAAYTYIVDMIDAGVKVYMYQPGYLHAKTISVDGIACSIGSANFDIRSFNIDYELNAILYDAAYAQRFEVDFLNDLRECVPFDLLAYKKLPFHTRFRDAASRLLSPLL
jgi:cardiolipin synthase